MIEEVKEIITEIANYEPTVDKNNKKIYLFIFA